MGFFRRLECTGVDLPIGKRLQLPAAPPAVALSLFVVIGCPPVGGRVKHNNNFNLLRLFAAVQVVSIHSVGHLHLPMPQWLLGVLLQFPGVPIFFIISGFLVTDSMLRSDGSAVFLWKRAVRIYPGLIANIVVLEAAMAIGGGLVIVSWLGYFFLYLPIYAVTASAGIASPGAAVLSGLRGGVARYDVGFYPFYPSGVLWTLTVELSFYIALPIFLMLVERRRTAGVATIFLAMAGSLYVAMATAAPFSGAHPYLDLTVERYFWIFGLGIFARLYWDRISSLFVERALLWIGCYAILIWYKGPTGLFAPVTSAFEPLQMILLAGAIFSVAFSFTGLTARMRIDKNDYSYGLYLYHMLVISTFLGAGVVAHWWLWPSVYVLGFSLAAASWFLVERPALRLKKLPAWSPPSTGRSASATDAY